MKIKFILLLCVLSFQAWAGDDPKVLLRELNRRFSLISDYTARVDMRFDIPGVKMNALSGKVFFKRPDKFRIRTKGIFFLPKQNPMQGMNAMLMDTTSYTSIISGYETFKGKRCAIVNIIPLKSSDELILGKFWIDVANPIVYKSQVTTRNNGTIEAENIYTQGNRYFLPDQVIIRVEMRKIKMSKMMSVDLNKKAKKKGGPEPLETGLIMLSFRDYRINTHFSDAELEKEAD